MAQKVWRTITVNTARPSAVLYWVKKFFDDVQTSFPNRISIVDSYAGTGGSWNSETSVGTKAYIVIQAYHAWSDGKKWECLIGACNNGTETLGDYTDSLAIGLWTKFAPNGGWGAGGVKKFGNTPETGFLEVRGGSGGAFTGATTLNVLAVVDKIVDGVKTGEVFILVGANYSSIRNMGIYVGHYYDAEPTFAKPACLFAGVPSRGSGSGAWGYITARRGRVINTNLDAMWEARLFYSTQDLASGQLLTRSGSPFLMPIPLYAYDGTTERTAGWLCEVWFGDSTLTDGIEDTTNKRVIFNTLAWPGGDKS